jgi:hypothetical protein
MHLLRFHQLVSITWISLPVRPRYAPAGHPGLRASYALDIYHVIIQKRATGAGP